MQSRLSTRLENQNEFMRIGDGDGRKGVERDAAEGDEEGIVELLLLGIDSCCKICICTEIETSLESCWRLL